MATVLRRSEPTALLNLAQKKLPDLDPKKVEPVANPSQASLEAHPEEIQRHLRSPANNPLHQILTLRIEPVLRFARWQNGL